MEKCIIQNKDSPLCQFAEVHMLHSTMTVEQLSQLATACPHLPVIYVFYCRSLPPSGHSYDSHPLGHCTSLLTFSSPLVWLCLSCVFLFLLLFLPNAVVDQTAIHFNYGLIYCQLASAFLCFSSTPRILVIVLFPLKYTFSDHCISSTFTLLLANFPPLFFLRSGASNTKGQRWSLQQNLF